MATIHRLTDRQVRAATKPLCDGRGLWIYPRGESRSWVYRYTLAGKAREMGLGGYPDTTLAQAREQAAELRALLKQGVDPLEHRRAQRAPVHVPTFTQAAAAYIRAQRHAWQNRKHARQWPRSLRTHARPVLGELPVNAITTEHVLAALTPIWQSRTETAARVQSRIENVLDFAAAMKWRDQANPARWKGHLDKLLPRPSRVKRQRAGGADRHHSAMPYKHLPAFMRELRQHDGVSARALELLILTAARSNEVIGATWEEIDLEARIWIVPAARMKARREHRVPLSEAAMDVLARLPRIAGNRYVFPGTRYGTSIGPTALYKTVRLFHGVYTVHGFRSSFRDWASEVATAPHAVCEMALAHAVAGKTEAAYRRGDLFEKRVRLMNEWAQWCNG